MLGQEMLVQLGEPTLRRLLSEQANLMGFENPFATYAVVLEGIAECVIAQRIRKALPEGIPGTNMERSNINCKKKKSFFL